MKKISVMVVVALMSASMFAGNASLPTKTKKANVTATKAEVKHKQDKAGTKDKAAAKEKKTHKKQSKQQTANQVKTQK